MARFFITGVWKDSQQRITHVFIHPYDEKSNTFSGGSKKTEVDALAYIHAGHIIHTLIWNYSTAKWKIGAKVEIVKEGFTEYLRTDKNVSVEDNLDNSINMQGFF